MAATEKPKSIANGISTESAGLGISGSKPTMANGETRESSDSEKEIEVEGGFTVVTESAPPSILLSSDTAGIQPTEGDNEGLKGEDKVGFHLITMLLHVIVHEI